jgi:hypothetical protein
LCGYFVLIIEGPVTCDLELPVLHLCFATVHDLLLCLSSGQW